MRSLDPSPSPELVAEAEWSFRVLKEAAADEQWRIAQLLASKSDAQLLGRAESEAKALETALEGRKKGEGYQGRA